MRRIDDHRARGLAARIVDDLAAEAIALLGTVIGIARIGIARIGIASEGRRLRGGLLIRERLAERKEFQRIGGSGGREEGCSHRRRDGKAANGRARHETPSVVGYLSHKPCKRFERGPSNLIKL